MVEFVQKLIRVRSDLTSTNYNLKQHILIDISQLKYQR